MRTNTSVRVGGRIRIESFLARDATSGGAQVHEVIWFTLETVAVFAMGTIRWTGQTFVNDAVVLWIGSKHITSLARLTTEHVVTLRTTNLTLLTGVTLDVGVLWIWCSLGEGSSRTFTVSETRGWSQEVGSSGSEVDICLLTSRTLIGSSTCAGGTLGVTGDTTICTIFEPAVFAHGTVTEQGSGTFRTGIWTLVTSSTDTAPISGDGSGVGDSAIFPESNRTNSQAWLVVLVSGLGTGIHEEVRRTANT